MAKNNDKSSYLPIGIVMTLMGLAWFASMGAISFDNILFENWWAFGALLPVFYLAQSASTARQEGKPIIGYTAGAFGALAVLLAFLNMISWGAIGALGMVGVGIGFILESRS